MKAINLIPSDSSQGGLRLSGLQAPAYAVVGLLAVAVVYVTVYVLTNNSISSRKAKLSTVQAQAAQAQSEAAGLSSYAQFASLATQRSQTVTEIAATRFDWYTALSDLSKVVPANTSLQTLFGSVAPGATVASDSGSGAGASSSLRQDLSVPAFELTGCTQSQDDVARLMSRLRLMTGVTRVTLNNSQKADSAGGSATSASSSTGGSSGCSSGAPTFDLIVFFSSLPGAGPNGVTSLSDQAASSPNSVSASVLASSPPLTSAPASLGSAGGVG